MALSVEQSYSQTDYNHLELLIQAMMTTYGKGFSNYLQSSVIRRVMRRKQIWNLASIGEMVPLITQNPNKWQVLFNDLSTPVTKFFRNAAAFNAIKQEVFPMLATFPFFKIWVVGCATGEEAYSLAILLHEQKLLSRARIYGTDFNDNILRQAKDGIYDQRIVFEREKAYQAAGGTQSLKQYFHIDELVEFLESYQQKVENN